MIERKYLPPALAVLGSTIGLITTMTLDSLEHSTLGKSIPTPQHILTPLSEWRNRCPDGFLPVVTKKDAFCRQSQLTPIATPHR